MAKEKHGAKLMGIDVEHVYAMSFGIGLACLGAAACFLLPAYYVNPQVGTASCSVAFTIVVLGGMGSFAGALVGGLADRRGRVAGRAVARRIARPDRHLPDLHRRAAVPAAGPVRGEGMKDLAHRRAFAALVGAVPLSLDSGVTLNFIIDGAAMRAAGAGAGTSSAASAASSPSATPLFFGTGAYVQAIAAAAFGWNAWLGVAAGDRRRRGGRRVRRRADLPLRPAGSYFALVTLAFAEVFRILASVGPFTGAGVGLMLAAARVGANMQFAAPRGYLLAGPGAGRCWRC